MMFGSQSVLTEQEAADFLGISVRTLANERRAGRVPHSRLTPRVIRYTTVQLTQWLEQRKVLTKCRDSNSGNFGSPFAAIPGPSRGSTKSAARRGVFRQALEILKKPKGN